MAKPTNKKKKPGKSSSQEKRLLRALMDFSISTEMNAVEAEEGRYDNFSGTAIEGMEGWEIAACYVARLSALSKAVQKLLGTVIQAANVADDYLDIMLKQSAGRE